MMMMMMIMMVPLSSSFATLFFIKYSSIAVLFSK